MLLEIDFDALGPPAGALRADGFAAPGVLLQPGTAAVAVDGDAVLVLAGAPRDPSSAQPLDAAGLLARVRMRGTSGASLAHGSYACVFIDLQARSVLLENDRMARRSWCYSRTGAKLRVADRADTLGAAAELDPQAVFTYLFNHVIPSPATIFSGVQRLPPAHRLLATRSETALAPHWQPVFTEPRSADFGALRDEFRALLRNAVAQDLAAAGSGRTGTFLSGGTDSSTVSGMLKHVSDAGVRAYSIGFDADGYDEMAYARIAARHFGLEHREYYLTPDDVAGGMPLVATSYDQPFGNSSAVAAYHCARVAREDGCTTLLAGDGGDELFGGNARYAKQSIFGWYEGVPAPLRKLLLEPLLDNRVAQNLPGVSKAASYVHQARVPMPERLQMYNLLFRLGLDQVLTPAFRARVEPGQDGAAQRRVYERSHGERLINRMLAFDWTYTLADNDLPKVIGTTSLAGVGAAFPLLADAVVDFSLRLPAHYKLNGLKLRWFFKEALRGFLPDEIITKKKQGFGLPFGVWALRHAQLSKLADDALASFGERGVVQPAFLSKLRRDLLPAHPGYYGELVWIIAMLEFWLREKRPQFRIA